MADDLRIEIDGPIATVALARPTLEDADPAAQRASPTIARSPCTSYAALGDLSTATWRPPQDSHRRSTRTAAGMIAYVIRTAMTTFVTTLTV